MYLYNPMHIAMLEYLCFKMNGRVFQFICYHPKPGYPQREFTKLLHQVVQQLHFQSVKLQIYLDDGCIRASLSRQFGEHTALVLPVLQHLGWIINFKKSELIPSQGFNFRVMCLKVQSTLDPWTVYPNIYASNLHHPRSIITFIEARCLSAPSVVDIVIWCQCCREHHWVPQRKRWCCSQRLIQQMMCNNTVALSCIRKEGGTRSFRLQCLMTRLLSSTTARVCAWWQYIFQGHEIWSLTLCRVWDKLSQSGPSTRSCPCMHHHSQTQGRSILIQSKSCGIGCQWCMPSCHSRCSYYWDLAV